MNIYVYIYGSQRERDSDYDGSHIYIYGGRAGAGATSHCEWQAFCDGITGVVGCVVGDSTVLASSSI